MERVRHLGSSFGNDSIAHLTDQKLDQSYYFKHLFGLKIGPGFAAFCRSDSFSSASLPTALAFK